MLKKVIRLNLDDLFLCLGVVTGLFVLIQGVIAAVLLLSAENSGIMILFKRSMPREMPKTMTANVMMRAAACQPMLPKSPVI